MILRGTIFLHNRFKFKNGDISNKYLILLNTPAKGEPYLLVKTTSQQKTKPKTPGCIKRMSVFFVPGRKAFFPDDTWVQLFELYEIIGADKDPEYMIRGILDSAMVDEIIRCFFSSQHEDLSPAQKKLLKPPISDNINRLKEFFDKRRP